MPWCKNCKEEYEQGIEACVRCGALLTDVSPLSAKQQARYDAGLPICEDPPPHMDEAFLIKTVDQVELTYIASLLEEADIGYRTIRGDTSEYVGNMTGYVYSDVSIYVDAHSVKEARQIVESLRLQTLNEADKPADELPGDGSYAARRVAKWMIWAFLAVAIIIPLGIMLFAGLFW